MTPRDYLRVKRLMTAVVLGVLICWVLLYLAEYCDVHWVREAGGGIVRASF